MLQTFLLFNILFYICYALISASVIIKTFLIKKTSILFYLYIIRANLLLICGDIETKPGPRKDQNLSICHWNLSISAHNFIKFSSLQAFNTIHNFDLICISETFLDSSVAIDGSDLSLNGYKLIRSDHPSDVKRGGICIFYKNILPIRFLNITNLTECLICEILYDHKMFCCVFVSFSQSNYC